jgi:hypothetical protein
MKTFLRGVGGALVLLAAGVAAAVLALVAEPQWFLTTRTVGTAVSVFGAAYHPRWSRFDFSIRSLRFLEKEVYFRAVDACFDGPGGSASGCFKSLGARFDLSLSPAGVRLTRIVSLDAAEGRVRVDATKPVNPTPSPAPKRSRALAFFPLPDWRRLEIDQASVSLAAATLTLSSGTIRGGLRLDYSPALAHPLELDVHWEEGSGRAARRGRAHALVASDYFKTGNWKKTDARGAVAADGAIAEFGARLRPAGTRDLALTATASGRRGGLSFRLQARGVETSERYALGGGFDVRTASGPLRSLRAESFSLTAARAKEGVKPTSLRLEARLLAEPASFPAIRGLSPPKSIAARLVLNARASPTLLQKDHFDAELTAETEPGKGWYAVSGGLQAEASGRLSQLASMKVRHRTEMRADIPRFEDLIAFLADGPYSIPAPFDALKGALKASLILSGDPREDRQELEYGAKADLSGVKQRLKFHIDGKGVVKRPAAADRTFKIDGTATFDDVALEAPHLEPLKMPHMILDARIKGADAPGPAKAVARRFSAAPAASGAVDVRIVTAKPILVYSDLAKSPVPIVLALSLERPPGRLTGTAELGPCDVEFFRRKAQVKSLKVTLRPGAKVPELDGLIEYKAAEATIRIRFLGTTDKPQLVFESDPPMSQSDIIAMLVFGKSPDELDADQTATVANTQTAMSDEAFGLASLYLFASTPIQFVGYDPATKSYTMKFHIPGGETLSLNSDFDATKSVQLRKRLSKHFAIQAEAVNSQTQGNGVVTFLEWFTRY